VPAPAVIPAPIAYTKFAAVKKLVVGLQRSERPVRQQKVCTGACSLPSGNFPASSLKQETAPDRLP